jgi:Zn-dependent protease
LTSYELAQIIIWVGLFLALAGPVHECAHAYAAWRLGDGTAKLFGRLTLNPIVHFDPIGGLMLAFSAFASMGTFAFGWAKPTPVNPYNLRGAHADSLVALAGPASNLVLAAIFAIVLRAIGGGNIVIHDGQLYQFFYNGQVVDSLPTPLGLASLVCYFGVLLNVLLAIFNLIPIPPLDGSHILYDLLSPRTVHDIRPYLDQYGFMILILMIIPLGGTSLLGRVFDAVGWPVITLLVGS